MNVSPLDQLKLFFKQKNSLVNLVKINILIWLPIAIISLFSALFESAFSDNLINWLAVPSGLGNLAIKPWTIFTYMFLHKDFFHILFNMLMLYFGGMLFVQFIGERKILKTYIWGGIFGSVFYILAFNTFPAFEMFVNHSYALGASASVLAILIAVATFTPDTNVQLVFLGNVKLKYIAIVLVLIDILSIEKGNPGGHIAHLGGAFFGFLYGINLKRNIFRLPDFKITNPFKRERKLKFSKNEKRPVSDEAYNEMKSEKQKKIDFILDKISKSGYDKLTKEEKDFLFRSSNN